MRQSTGHTFAVDPPTPPLPPPPPPEPRCHLSKAPIPEGWVLYRILSRVYCDVSDRDRFRRRLPKPRLCYRLPKKSLRCPPTFPLLLRSSEFDLLVSLPRVLRKVREDQLGYTSVDAQPTPRSVSVLKSKVVAVAAANRHTAVVSESGEVFTWGCNTEGQLNYGTSNSGSNYTPGLVEYLKAKVLLELQLQSITQLFWEKMGMSLSFTVTHCDDIA